MSLPARPPAPVAAPGSPSTAAGPASSWSARLLTSLLRALARLPLPLLYGLAGLLYVGLAHVGRYRRAVVFDNLRHAFPTQTAAERRRLARRFYWHLAQLTVEALKLLAISPIELRERVRFTNPGLLGDYLVQGRTVLGVSSHLSNWEWVLAGAAVRFPGQVVGVYKPLNNKFFERFVRQLRTRLGAEVVPMFGTLRYLAAHRGQGRIVSLVSDQAAGSDDRPYWTDFLHRPAGFYTSVDRLVPQFDAVVLYARARRVGRGYYEVTFLELRPDSLPDATDPGAARYPFAAAFVRQLEADIQAAPEEYLWTHRRWKHAR